MLTYFIAAFLFAGPAFGFVTLFVHFLVTKPNLLHFVLNLVAGGVYFSLYSVVYMKLKSKYPDLFEIF